MIPFSITTNYMEGTIDGSIRVQAKPNIILYRIPRSFDGELFDSTELKQAGIYFLVNEEKRTVYVGQASQREDGEGVFRRMLENHSSEEIDDWDVGFVLLGGSSEFLGVTELNYLERFFYDGALRARRYKVLNKAKPSLTLVDPATKMILNNYTVLALFLLQHQFNCRAFVGPEGFFPGQKLYLNNAAKDVQATGIMQTFKQILVKKGSKISKEDRLPMQKGQGAYAVLRKNLIQKGIIVDFVFVEDHEFPSTSSAASVILGQAASGMDTWQQVIDPESVPDEKIIEQFPLTGSTLYLNRQSKGVQATAIMQSSKRIIVQKDSTVSPYDRLPYQKGAEGYAALRKQLIDNGVIVDFKFTEDYEFSSTSSAASVILGQSASGTDSWKSENEPESLGTKVDWTPLIGHMLYLDNIKKDIKATCIVKSARQFVVKAGSTISQDNRLPYHKGAHKYDALRNQLIKDGIITDFIFVRDYEFSSSSVASAVILGRSSSGLVAWKDESGNKIETILPKINKEIVLPDFADEESQDKNIR